MLLLKTVFFFFLINYKVNAQIGPIVQTQSGTVQGKEFLTIGQNRPYLAFQGIPFAEPPIGDLRFKPPIPKKPWDGVWNATFDRPSCIQSLNPVQGSEDCLFINVYKPKTADYNLPVMVFIYGGTFVAGSSQYNMYAPDYLLEKDVIVVSFNYRLGIFGFLSTGTLEVPGNTGLKDQVLALKWVQENIAYFGGNPNNVTVFGQSAGSASISYHLQSPKSKGLFQKAIMESGTSLCLWALTRQAPEMAKLIAESFQIDTDDWGTVVEGLRNITAIELQERSELITSSQYLVINPRDGLLLGPVREPEHEDAFFSAKSHELLESGAVSGIPIIIGFNSLEALFEFNNLMRVFFSQYDMIPSKITPIDLNIDNSTVVNNVGLEIKQEYFTVLPIAMSNLSLMKYISDDQFLRAIREFVRLIYPQNPVYFYEFSYEGHLFRNNRTELGVGHSEELGYIWRSSLPPTPQDVVVRDRMTTLWTNFAKYGNPTPDFSLNFVWERVSNDNLTYLDIGNDLTMKENVESDKMSFWDSLYEAYGNPPFDTY